MEKVFALIIALVIFYSVPRILKSCAAQRLQNDVNQITEHVDKRTELERAAEAQSELRKMLFLQQRFQKKHGSYTTDLIALGWEPWNIKRTYKIGFTVPANENIPGVESLDSNRKDSGSLGGVSTSDPNEPTEIEFSQAGKYCRKCTATKDSFTAVAIGKIPPNGKIDVWTIDELEKLDHLTP